MSKTFLNILILTFLIGGSVYDAVAQKEILMLNSHSFNAKKRSSFVVSGVEEYVERGLTLVHFNTPEKYEYKSFDTYGSEESLNEFIVHLKQMIAEKAFFAILAHDSAVKGALKKSNELDKMGLSQLSLLKGRQAYSMFFDKGQLQEIVNDISVTKEIEVPNDILDKHIYFPKITYEFEPNNDRYIAHAGGEVKGIKSTNTKNALDENYKKGFRLFELDIIKTSDGKLVAAHDWKMWSRFTDYNGTLPPTHAEFMKHKIYGEYETLDMEGINNWFRAHPDATLITDKLNDPVAFSEVFVDKSRLIMELFSVMSMDEASRKGINIMISQEPLFALKGDKVNYLKVNNIKYAAVSRRIIKNQTKLLLALKENGIRVYVYNVNFDPGKDERYVQDNEIGLVYGMYADKWVFD